MRFIYLFLSATLLLFSCTSVNSSNQSLAGSEISEPEPYEKDEFPRWAQDLRRGEIIYFGSLPLVFMLTNLAYDNIVAQIEQQQGENLDFSTDEHTQTKIAITLSLSGVLTLTDYIIGLFEKDVNHARN